MIISLKFFSFHFTFNCAYSREIRIKMYFRVKRYSVNFGSLSSKLKFLNLGSFFRRSLKSRLYRTDVFDTNIFVHERVDNFARESRYKVTRRDEQQSKQLLTIGQIGAAINNIVDTMFALLIKFLIAAPSILFQATTLTELSNSFVVRDCLQLLYIVALIVSFVHR